MPRFPNPKDHGGFSVDLWVRFREMIPSQTLLDSKDESGRGFHLFVTGRSTLGVTMNDCLNEAFWDSDPGTGASTLRVGHWQHLVVIVDAGPWVISLVVDGVLNDGGVSRQYGWGLSGPELGDLQWGGQGDFGGSPIW